MYLDISVTGGGKIRRISSNLERETAFVVDNARGREYAETAGAFVIKLVATLEKTDPGAMRKSSRGKADICLARQMAMYLMHTVFSCSYHQVADYFGRDRTTISHACRLVEDLRDNQDFDKRLEAMENLLVSARCLGELVKGSNRNG